METNKEVYCVHERINKSSDHKSEPEPARRNFDSRRVSKSILKDILKEIHKVNDMPYTPCRIIKIKKAEVPKEKEIMEKREKKPIPLNKTSSMSSLIMWNISKALELRPCMDLKGSIRAVNQRLDTNADGRELSIVSKDHPEEQHLLCALLAWQKLGHQDADSLYSFVELKKEEKAKHNNKDSKNIRESIKSININRNSSHPTPWNNAFNKPSVSGSFGSHTTGPIVRLPVESFIMQIENNPHTCCGLGKSSRRVERDIATKVDEANAFDTTCVEALATLDTATNTLRSRAAQLARREAKRVQLLERAENAWSELEAGYNKRLAMAQEKEDDLKRQLKKMIDELGQYKKNCGTCYPEALSCKANFVGKAREQLTVLEKKVCALASTKLQLSEESAKGEAALSQELCKCAQYERELKFQEDQTRRLLESKQNEAESARALTCEAERAMRAELGGLRKQIEDVSKDLLKEDAQNLKIKAEHEALRKEKATLIEDLEGCKAVCDKKMQGQLDDLMKKKEKLLELQEHVLKCQCQLPIDEKVQVKRTPSLAAMCYCAPEDQMQDSCSCTSLRDRLLSSLLADLFSGLQGELGRAGSQMPCQLLKCLEDNHNWDRRTDTKTNLRAFFSKLLKSELDIAIATSIENYHAKWVGNACADAAKMIPTLEDNLKEGWQQRAIERRAQQMASQLAEELLQERAEEIEQRAIERATAGPPPCVCKPPTPVIEGCVPECCTNQTALYPCLMHENSPFTPSPTSNTGQLAPSQPNDVTPPANWAETIQEVTQLKQQIEDLKKDSVRKEHLKRMKDDISKLFRETSVLENEDLEVITKGCSKFYKDTRVRSAKRDEYPKTPIKNKLLVPRSSANKDNENSLKKVSINERPTKLSKKKGHEQSYAVNLCFCGPQKKGKSLQNAQLNNSEKWKQKSLKDVMPKSSIVKQSKPINFSLPSSELLQHDSEISEPCNSNCKCFRKIPSNTSIDKLLQVLASCNFDMVSRETCIKHIQSCLSKCSPTVIQEAMQMLNQNDSKNIFSFLAESNNTQVNASDFYKDTQMKTSGQSGSFSKQPVTTESEYMGTVYLDKSHENLCKCLINLAESEQDKKEDGNNSVPFQCINTNTCGCTMYQDQQKDNKRSQTEELHKVQVQSHMCQVTRSKDVSKFNEFNSSPINSHYLNDQTEMKLKSDLKTVPRNTELFSTGGECCIKFLGVTLDDSSSVRNKKNKAVDDNVGDLPEEKHALGGRKLPKKSPNIDQTNQDKSKHNVLSRERHYQTGIDDKKKCECKAKFEEFTGFMDNLLDNKLLENTHKNKVLDKKRFKHKTIEPCVSCNCVNVDDSGDLEVNAFHLLEDHIKQKFEDYKSLSCNICIPPEEEQKFFSAILQRVKQVISDCANNMKCGCSKTVPPYKGSWDRAYGLLQEYLKVKIKRVQCLCVLNENKKDVILPEVLEKVCNLIENDFQRLRDICKCKNSSETRIKIVRMGDLVPPTELPEKDTNNSQAIYNDAEVQQFSIDTNYSEQNSYNSIIPKENVSPQENRTFGMASTSSAITRPFTNRNIIKTTETDHIFTDNKSNGVMYSTCDCCYNTDKIDIRKFPEMFGNKEVSVNLYGEKFINASENCALPTFGIDKQPPAKPISIIKMGENGEIKQDLQNSTGDVPYIGFTGDGSCDSALGPCFCTKSVIQANNDKSDSVWKEFALSNRDEAVNCHLVPNDVVVDKTSKSALLSVDISTHETGTIAENEENIILKYSPKSNNFSTQAANTLGECFSSDTAEMYSNSNLYPVDWLQIAVPMNSGRSNAVKLANSIYFPGLQTDNERNSLISGSAADSLSQKNSETCGCQKVPICHIKMLVEHIEKNLVEFKCTCDSLISKVCPVHSKRVY